MFFLCIILFIVTEGARTTKPNIIVFIADDMGWNDVGFHGSSEIPTPNIDSLAYNGVIFDKHYVQQSCTPSRAAFLTGQYPIRLGFQGFPSRPGEDRNIPHNITTLPESLRQLGYSTHLLGKWHLGFGYKDSTPLGYGYEHFYGYYSGFVGYFNHTIRNFALNGIDFHENLAPVTDQEGVYFTDLLTERAKKVISKQPKDKPLHMVVSHLAPHTGKMEIDLVGEMEVANQTEVDIKYSYIQDSIRRKYADAVQRMDDSIGQVIAALDEKGILDNSVIVFFSDNGAPTIGTFKNRGSNFPFRGVKMTLFEGGIRVPAILYTPKLRSKGRIFKNMFHITDWVPTLYSAAGGNISDLGPIDGIDQWANIVNNYNKNLRKEILINYDEVTNYYGVIGYEGRYKLLYRSFDQNKYDNLTGSKGRSVNLAYDRSVIESAANSAIGSNLTRIKQSVLRVEATKPNCRLRKSAINPVVCSGFCVFDLLKDPCETFDVSKNYPGVTKYLLSRIEFYRAQLVAQQNKLVDSKSDPALCNGTWFNWMEGSVGCWYTSNKRSR